MLPPAIPELTITTGGAFPVGRIFCVGRNYAAHAREMSASDREPPFFFIKPASCLLAAPGDLLYPPRTADLHHEVELVIAIRSGGANIAPGDANSHIFGYGCGLDMTRRDLQAEAKDKRRPWDMAKSFDGAAVCAALTPASDVTAVEHAEISLDVNAVARQHGLIAEMIWSVHDIVTELSTYLALASGDLIYTGTPAGVGAVQRGDRLTARITGLAPLDITIR